MSEDYFRYDLMVQDALRGVVREVLRRVVDEGLPGEHHFYIAFRTKAPGVKISRRFQEKYPDEMTIVIQYQFWDLVVTDDRFEIGLSFNNVPEKLVVPFAALTGFMDPSTQFGLQFEHPAANDTEAEESAGGSLVPAISEPNSSEDVKSSKKKKPKKSAKSKATDKSADGGKKDKVQDDDHETPHVTGEVVQLDAFRKKS